MAVHRKPARQMASAEKTAKTKLKQTAGQRSSPHLAGTVESGKRAAAANASAAFAETLKPKP